jgi:hypothetical protein
MNAKVKIMYESAIKNSEFLIDIAEADNDKKPGIFASEVEEAIFAAVYYGWLVGKYGNNWKSNL